MSLGLLLAASVATAAPLGTRSVAPPPPTLAGPWRAQLDLAGGPLRFQLALAERKPRAWEATVCNGSDCQRIAEVQVAGDSLRIYFADYDATILARTTRDSMAGEYRNVGNRGPRVIPFRASRGRWPAERPQPSLLGRWDAWLDGPTGSSPRVFEMRAARSGLEGAVITNTGDYGLFWGTAAGDSLAMGHFDGSFVYLVTGRLVGDTLTGIFHAGLRTQTPFRALRSTGRPHLLPPDQVTRADTTAPFRFAFRDLEGRLVTQDDERFKGKVVLLDLFGTWCPTCHDAAPTLLALWREFHAQGLEIVGLAYEVTGDTAVDAPLVRRFRDKFGIPWPLLLAGRSQTDLVQATQPQLAGAGAFPTSIFVGRDGRVRRVHAGFTGPATGAQHERVVREFRETVERLLAAH